MKIFSACPVKNLGEKKIILNFFSSLLSRGIQIPNLLTLKSFTQVRTIFNGVCLLFFFLLFFLTVPLSLAHTDYQFPSYTEGQINEALAKTVPLRFLPSNPLYFLITAKETVSRFFRPPSFKKVPFFFFFYRKKYKKNK